MAEANSIVARREKKALRREKQRRENIHRAQKMHRARLEEPLPRAASQEPASLHVGCSGWFYWGWKGLFYPEDLSTSRWFEHYSKHFRTVELNAPFYSWPTVATVKNWVKQAGRRRFIYTVKVSELITHTRRFNNTQTLIKDFGYIADLLGPRMGCFLFQLPPSFHYSPARLKAIMTQLDHSRRNVVEFRHASWWNRNVYAAFRTTGTIFCSCSGPRLPDELVRTADDIYVRFHGPQRWYRHDYSRQELEIWAGRIKESGAARVWAYFNNDYEGYAVANAKQLYRLLRPIIS